jgi:hypothetical protein
MKYLVNKIVTIGPGVKKVIVYYMCSVLKMEAFTELNVFRNTVLMSRHTITAHRDSTRAIE